MFDPILFALAAKMAIAAAVVVVAALVVERSGPFLGAMIVTLPIAAGPAYAFLAMEHPPEFLAASAFSSLIANAATAVYIAVFAILAQRHGVIASLGSALLVWLGIVAAANSVAWTLPQLLALNIVLYWAAFAILGRLTHASSAAPGARAWWEIPLRAVAVMGVAGAVILLARLIGPRAAGLVALAPIAFSSMAVVLHRRLGGRAASAVFANALPGMIGFGIGLLTVHLAVVPLGAWGGLTAALGVCLAWNAGLIVLRRRS